LISNNATSNTQSLAPDLPEILRGVKTFCQLGYTYELRALTRRRGTVAGYFNDLQKLANAAYKCSAGVYHNGKGLVPGYEATGVYVTINPTLNTLLARSANCTREYVPRDDATKDDEIDRRCWLPIDCDFKRPSGISSTDVEHEAAIARAVEIYDYLGSIGWTDGVVIDSGNGGHVLFPIDLPNDEPSTQLVKRVLKGLNAKFGRDGIKIDEVNYNASRIWKLPGTICRKGSDLVGRPHRVARILVP
jgi:hypothetical protein